MQFSCPEEKWAFYSRLAYWGHYALKPSRLKQELYGLVWEKDYFVVISNGEDHFTPAVFLPERVFEMEGKLMQLAMAEPNCTYITFNKGE